MTPSFSRYLLCVLCVLCASAVNLFLLAATSSAQESPHRDAATKPSAKPTTKSASKPATTKSAANNYHLHLNGIGGYRSIDKGMLAGLRDGGMDSDVRTYDWTGADVGLAALTNGKRHRAAAKKVEDLLERWAERRPPAHITVTTHSAGAGIIVWALEQLPEGVMIDSLVLLAPALSPNYDLSAALRHVSGKVYVFYSPFDAVVLGLGTSMMGTVDGVKTEAAGKVGFTQPAGADADQYAKLVQIPYDSAWIRLGNIGDHIGVMSRPFARQIIAPAMLDGNVPAKRFLGALAATQPTTAPTP